jgi:hypothetical protein
LGAAKVICSPRRAIFHWLAPFVVMEMQQEKSREEKGKGPAGVVFQKWGKNIH